MQTDPIKHTSAFVRLFLISPFFCFSKLIWALLYSRQVLHDCGASSRQCNGGSWGCSCCGIASAASSGAFERSTDTRSSTCTRAATGRNLTNPSDLTWDSVELFDQNTWAHGDMMWQVYLVSFSLSETHCLSVRGGRSGVGGGASTWLFCSDLEVTSNSLWRSVYLHEMECVVALFKKAWDERTLGFQHKLFLHQCFWDVYILVN